jgi:hypothetical protein
MRAPGDAGDSWFAGTLAMADIEPIARGRMFFPVPSLETPFVLDAASGQLLVGPPRGAAGSGARLLLRHAAELGLQALLCPDDPVLAGLAAARGAALFARLELGEQELGALPLWHAVLGADAPPAGPELQACWSALAVHQPGAPRTVSPATASALIELWPLLGPAEHLMGTGGDVRIKLDPETGLNAYGCSSRPRPWAVTFASSTASSISERGYAGAEAARREILGHALAHGAEAGRQAASEAVRRALGAHYQLPEGARIVLAPSGTDGELCALAVAHLGPGGASLANLLVASEETGTGVPLAAAGRHFDRLTARGVSVVRETVIEGFPPDVELNVITVRDPEGRIRPQAALAAECAAKVSAAVGRGRRVLLHVMDQSKTGLVVADAVAAVGERPEVDVLVDACQARLSAAAVGRYLRRGFMVLLTGSKFFTGPPFAGALLLPPAVARRLDGARALPRGLGDYFGRFDWPDGAEACRELGPDGNLGLVLRWQAALAEMRAFVAVGEARIKEVLGSFGDRIRAGILANVDLCLHATPPPARAGDADAWDALQTLFAFSIWTDDATSQGRRLMRPDEARQIYSWLNCDVSAALPARAAAAERARAATQFHLGQPVAIATPDGPAGALRISAGARLVSGEPSQAALEPDARLRAEIEDALGALDKISLLLRHLDRIRALDPQPRYRP